MKRIITSLSLGMAATVGWAQALATLAIDYTYKGTFVDRGARIDGQTFVTPSLMRRIGWTVDVQNGMMSVLAEGRTFQLDSKLVGDARLYNLDEALKYVGASSTWDEGAKLVSVLGQVRLVEPTVDGVRVDCTTSVRPRAFRQVSPDRIVFDFEGAALSAKAATGLPDNWKLTQINPRTVRVVIESPNLATQPVPTLEEGRSFDIKIDVLASKPKPVEALALIGTPTKGQETLQSVGLSIPYAGQLKSVPGAVFIDPKTVQVLIPGSSLDPAARPPILAGALLESVTADDDHNGTCTVTVKLKRAMAFRLSSVGGSVFITFLRPTSAGGLLGKVVVVDAGHGGKDGGATHGGVQEKVQALAIAKAVAAALSQAGASVIMTRNDDTFVSLNERPGLANRSRADLFISCHFNSNSVDESRSGTIIFYHNGDQMDQLLAECIRQQVGRLSGLPELGAWSDGKIYSSGFAVLRGAQMPAVLMELGFLNHSRDRSKIQTQAFRDDIAEAVVKGVKEFFGEEK
jgi:N-acetylmuramoyl-L-alanine amidase